MTVAQATRRGWRWRITTWSRAFARAPRSTSRIRRPSTVETRAGTPTTRRSARQHLLHRHNSQHRRLDDAGVERHLKKDNAMPGLAPGR